MEVHCIRLGVLFLGQGKFQGDDAGGAAFHLGRRSLVMEVLGRRKDSDGQTRLEIFCVVGWGRWSASRRWYTRHLELTSSLPFVVSPCSGSVSGRLPSPKCLLGFDVPSWATGDKRTVHLLLLHLLTHSQQCFSWEGFWVRPTEAMATGWSTAHTVET